MKVACVYHPREHTGNGKFHFVAEALRAVGHDVTHVQTLPELREADLCCDLILFEQRGPASLCLPDLVEFAKVRHAVWIQWVFDLNLFEDALPIEKQPSVEPFLNVARSMDLVLVKERDYLTEYKCAGIPALWFDQACPSQMRQATIEFAPEFDVILWGSASRPMWRQRWEDVEALVAAGFNVAWATNDGNLPAGVHRLLPCQPLELPGLIEQAKISLVVDARQDLRGYWSDRIWLAAGAGACIVRRFGTVDQHGGGNLPAMGYGSQAVLVNAVRDLCDDHSRRRWYGNFARKMTMNGHVYESRVKELVNHAQRLIDQRHEDPALQSLQRQENHRAEVA